MEKNHKTNSYYHQLDQEYYLPVFKRFPQAMQKGEGCWLWDVEGKKYLDTLAGIAVNTLGYQHPEMLKTIREQSEKLLHISNFFVSPEQVKLAEKLSEISKMSRIFFTNSGAESVEGAIKIARKYAHSKGKDGTIVSFSQSFHGRTMATIATGQKKYQKGFDPIPQGFAQAKFNDWESVKKVADKNIAAFLIEPIQGEGGINPVDKNFLQKLKAFCDRNDNLLIFDEVQTGIGRTGKWFAKDHYQIEPDIMTLAKGLGGGIPVGAIACNEKVAEAVDFGDHGTTFGGNPLACAVALTVIDVIEKEKLLEKVQQNGDWFRQEIKNLHADEIKEVRGLGLMTGIELHFEAKDLVMDMLENGVIANATAGNVVRMVPPLIISKEELTIALETFKKSLQKIKTAHVQ